MWLPEMYPKMYTVAITMVPKASEMNPRLAIVKGASPLTISVAGTDPTPTKTRNAVPRNSAASFCHVLFSSICSPLSKLVGALAVAGCRLRQTTGCESIRAGVA